MKICETSQICIPLFVVVPGFELRTAPGISTGCPLILSLIKLAWRSYLNNDNWHRYIHTLFKSSKFNCVGGQTPRKRAAETASRKAQACCEFISPCESHSSRSQITCLSEVRVRYH